MSDEVTRQEHERRQREQIFARVEQELGSHLGETEPDAAAVREELDKLRAGVSQVLEDEGDRLERVGATADKLLAAAKANEQNHLIDLRQRDRELMVNAALRVVDQEQQLHHADPGTPGGTLYAAACRMLTVMFNEEADGYDQGGLGEGTLAEPPNLPVDHPDVYAVHRMNLMIENGMYAKNPHLFAQEVVKLLRPEG